MADPLSISASIAGLVTLADTVFLRLTKYIKSVKNAEKEIKELCKEVNLLGGAVNMLARLARGHELENEPFNKDFRMYHIEGCAVILTEISQKTKKYDGNTKSKVLKLMWPYTSSKTKELLAALSRHKENINLALTANSMEALLRCLAKEEDRERTTAAIQAEVRKTREIVVRIQEDSKRKDVLGFFLSYNPQPNYEMSVKLRHPRTGMWLVRLPAFQAWLQNAGSRLWLSGIPGAGKTVLAGSVIEQALARSSDNVATGFFFCDYKNDLTQRPTTILGTLAHQLARQSEHAYTVLEEYYCELHPEKSLPRSPDPDDLVRVIVAMAQAFDQVYVVVDGLDECQDSTEEVVRTLSVIAETSDEISITVLSRDEDNIRDHLQCEDTSFINIQIAAHKEDITEYVTSEIQQRIDTRKLHLADLSLKGEIVDGLVDGANGMYVVGLPSERACGNLLIESHNRFRWVSCQLDHLGYCMSDEQCREALRSLPPDLPETYMRILQRVPVSLHSYVQRTLLIIAYANPKLSFERLRELLSVPSDGSRLKVSALIREDAITRHCSSLVRKSNDGKFLEFAHFSVQEFLKSSLLQSSGLGMFSISESQCNRLLATSCVKYLELENFKHLPTATKQEFEYMSQRSQDNPLYDYAAIHWLSHAREEWGDGDLLSAAKRLFDPRKTPQFMSWAVTLALSLIKGDHISSDTAHRIEGIIAKSFQPLHLAAAFALPDVTSFLLRQTTYEEDKSVIGSALKFAVSRLNHDFLYSNILQTDYEYYTGSDPQFVLETVHNILECCQEVPENIIHTAITSWASTNNFCVIQLLLAEGVQLVQSDVDQFSKAFDDGLIDKLDWEESVCSFCEFLSSKINTSPLYFDMCRLVWDSYLDAREASPNVEWLNMYKIDSRISTDKATLEKRAISACRSLRLHTLQEVVKDPRVDLCSVTDSNGDGLLHVLMHTSPYLTQYEQHEIQQILNVLFGAGCRLSMRRHDGHTPLSLALRVGHNKMAKMILRGSQLDQEAWESPIPILLLVAERGTEEILGELLGKGLQIQSVDYETTTPLHCLGSRVTLGLVTTLETLLPGSREIRAGGKLPWELYLEKTTHLQTSVSVLDFLIQPFLFPPQPSEASRVWDYFSGTLIPDAYRVRHTADDLATYLVWAGISSHYETFFKRPAITAVVEGYIRNRNINALNPGSGSLMYFPLEDDTMCTLLQNTRHLSAFRQSDGAIHLLKLSISLKHKMTTDQLLLRGVAVHQRTGNLSSLEYVCALPAKAAEDVARFSQVLAYGDPALLNQTNPSTGLGLIHLSHKDDEPRFRREILKSMMSQGANPNLRVGFTPYDPPLVHHLKRYNCNAACALVENGADPTLTDTHGMSAIHVAIATKAISFLLLLEKGVTRAIDWEASCKMQCMSLLYTGLRPLHIAATYSVECLKFLLEMKPPIDIEAKADHGYTALHFAALGRNIANIDILVSYGADVNAQSVDGRTALHIAVSANDLRLVERLLELGSQLTISSNGMTPLMLAYQQNCQAIIDYLAPHAMAKPDSASGGLHSSAVANSLYGAIYAGNLASCQTLLGMSPNVDLQISSGIYRGLTPLAIAIVLGRPHIISWFLKRGANANFQHCNGWSAIQGMVQKPFLNINLQAMLEKYLTDGGSIFQEPRCLLAAAITGNNTKGLRALLEHIGANDKHHATKIGATKVPAISLAVNRVEGGTSPLHRAVQMNNSLVVQMLIQHGANLEARDQLSCTPLLLALKTPVCAAKLSIVSLLLKAGSNVECRDAEGATPFAYACQGGNFDLIRQVMSSGVNIHFTDRQKRTVLHYLALGPDLTTLSVMPSMFGRLVKLGIDPLQSERHGWTSVHLSMANRSMAAFLLNGDFQLSEARPIPWYEPRNSRRLIGGALLTSSFRLYRRRLPCDAFRSLLNMHPADAWSPLCLAAAAGETEAMQNLLLMGSQIDFEGCPEGSALMVAVKEGQFEAVTFLVHRGASISFQGRKQHWSAVGILSAPTRIIQWLLVGRFTHKSLIEAPLDYSPTPSGQVGTWSGIIKAEMVLLGLWERQSHESSRHYWSRLSQMKEAFQGNVVPSDQGAKTRQKSKLDPFERVKIAAGGYQNPKSMSI